MAEQKQLEKTLRTVIKTGKCVFGQRAIAKGLKGAKLVIASTSLEGAKRKELIATCESLGVPVLTFPGNSVRLASLCGRPFRISALAVKNAGDADLKPFLQQAQGIPSASSAPPE